MRLTRLAANRAGSFPGPSVKFRVWGATIGVTEHEAKVSAQMSIKSHRESPRQLVTAYNSGCVGKQEPILEIVPSFYSKYGIPTYLNPGFYSCYSQQSLIRTRTVDMLEPAPSFTLVFPTPLGPKRQRVHRPPPE